jgi:hypothetical protein
VEATDDEIGKLSGVAVDDEAQITDFSALRALAIGVWCAPG